MQITRSSIDTQKGPAEWFTGDVYIDAVAAPEATSTFAAASVHFTPGARTAWHTHPHGQTIFVTEGVGRCQRERRPRSRSSAPATGSSSSPARTTGTAPRRTASWSTSPCSRTTTSGSPVTWGEHVSDEQYGGGSVGMNPTYDFSGQVALVTGAGAGMGLDTARAFAAAGAAVVLADVNDEALRAATDELTAAGHRAFGVTCDVADEDQVAALVERDRRRVRPA